MADNKGTTSTAAGMKVDTKLVRQLAEMLADTGLTEIEVEDGDRKIRVARNLAAPAAGVIAAAPVVAPASAAAPAAPVAPPAEAAAAVPANALRSPMVGTAYLSGEPGAPPFVQVGDKVKKGQTLLIIEAMKVMNPIPAPADGTVQQVLVENAQPVEYDQPLIVVA